MRILSRAVLAALCVAAGGAAPASADILIRVDLGKQQMTVDVSGKSRHIWAVSSGREGYGTPTGTYRPQRMHTMWYSKKYDDAPMPHSIFYSGGFAIHGTQSVKMLGRPASHGCVRLAPGNARTLFSLVKDAGMSKTRIVIHGKPPAPAPAPAIAARTPRASSRVVTVRAQPSGGLFSDLFGSQPQPRVRYRQMAPRYGTVSRGTITFYRVPTYRVR